MSGSWRNFREPKNAEAASVNQEGGKKGEATNVPPREPKNLLKPARIQTKIRWKLDGG